MKIRTDFVTNSSSSSFIIETTFVLKNGGIINRSYIGDDEGNEKYRNIGVIHSPREMGQCKSVEELIELLGNSFVQGIDWSKPRGFKPGALIKEVKSNIKSMDDVQEVIITGTQKGRHGGFWTRRYSYNTETDEYKLTIEGASFESEGRGGDIRFDHSENQFESEDSTYSENYFDDVKDFVKRVKIFFVSTQDKNVEEEYIKLKVGDIVTAKVFDNYDYGELRGNFICFFTTGGKHLGTLESVSSNYLEILKIIESKEYDIKVVDIVPVSQKRKNAKNSDLYMTFVEKGDNTDLSTYRYDLINGEFFERYNQLKSEIVNISNANVGSRITFGKFVQTSDGIEMPLIWTVLNKDENGLFVFSEIGLESKYYYYKNDKSVSWEKSGLRKWLNNDFYNKAFSEDEKKIIFENTVMCESDESTHLNSKIERTNDIIFLLSIQEWLKYRDDLKLVPSGYLKNKTYMYRWSRNACNDDEDYCYDRTYILNNALETSNPDSYYSNAYGMVFPALVINTNDITA